MLWCLSGAMFILHLNWTMKWARRDEVSHSFGLVMRPVQLTAWLVPAVVSSSD